MRLPVLESGFLAVEGDCIDSNLQSDDFGEIG